MVVFHSEGHGAAGRPSVCRAFGTNGQSSSRIKNHHTRRLFFLCDPRHNKNRRVVLHAGDFWHKMNRAESKQKMLRKYAAQMSSLTISGYLGFGLELLQLLRRHRLLAAMICKITTVCSNCQSTRRPKIIQKGHFTPSFFVSLRFFCCSYRFPQVTI